MALLKFLLIREDSRDGKNTFWLQDPAKNTQASTAVQDLLGHSSLLTTAQYLRLSGQDVKNILRDREP